MIAQQMTLFDDPGETEHNEKQEKLEAALMDIRRKKGIVSIYRGMYDERELGVTNRKMRADGENSEEK
jgi:hypothetical protein